MLPSPQQFEELASIVDPEETREKVACGNDPDKQIEALQPFLDVGFDEVYVGNMGPHYADMIRQFGERCLPAVRATHAA